MGFMLCIFSLIYFVYLQYRYININRNRKNFIRTIIDYSIISILAVGSAFFVLLPVLFELHKGKMQQDGKAEYYTESVLLYLIIVIVIAFCIYVIKHYIFQSLISRRIYNRYEKLDKLKKTIVVVLFTGIIYAIMWKVINALSWHGDFRKEIMAFPLKFLVGAFNGQEIVKGLPNIYISCIAAGIFILYLVDQREHGRTKKANIFLVMSIVLSFAFVDINGIWHGFAQPSGSNYRYSFLLCFIILKIVNEYKISRISLDSISSSTIFIGVLLLICAVHVYRQAGMTFVSKKSLIISGVFITIYVLGFLLKKYIYKWKIIFLLVLSVELGLNMYISLHDIDHMEIEPYRDYLHVVEASKKIIAETDGRSDIYRMDSLYGYLTAWAYAGEYNSMYHYSSVTPHENVEFLSQFGMTNIAEMNNYSTIYNQKLSAELAGFLGIRYLITDSICDKESFQQIGEFMADKPVFVYQNEEAMPMAYLMDNSVLKITNGNHLNLNEISDDVAGYQNKTELSGLEKEGRSEYKYECVALQNETAVISIPYGEGWSAIIDGKKAEIHKAYGFFIGLQVGKGHHTILIKYTPPYFVLGIIVSVVSILLMNILIIYKKETGKELLLNGRGDKTI